jgi:serine/threonine protein kinase
MPTTIYSGKYEVQELIAKGGLGTVYKALDLTLNRVVALNVIHPHLSSDPSFLNRFLREVREMARLSHENIVTIFSVEQDHSTHYLVMEYFPGENLRNIINTIGVLPLGEAVNITRQIADALSFAHHHGIIHCNVQPKRVLVDKKNRAKLIDFGMAKALDVPDTSNVPVIGSVLYMSPEQVRDDILDGRSDLYSLGMTFYEMLTGINPRRNLSSNKILEMLLSEENMPTLGFPPSIPTEIQDLIEDLLKYRPVDRIQDADTLLDRLETLRPIWGGSSDSTIPLADLKAAAAEHRSEAVSRQNLSTPPRVAPKIFICYRRDDSADVTGRIYDRLVNQFGEASLFKDVYSIPYGVDFRAEIDKAISTCTAVLAIVGRRWLAKSGKQKQRDIDSPSDYVRIELVSALRRQIRIIPVLVAGGSMPAAETLPDDIRDFSYRNAIQVKPDPDFRNDMDRLIKGLLKLHELADSEI